MIESIEESSDDEANNHDEINNHDETNNHDDNDPDFVPSENEFVTGKY